MARDMQWVAFIRGINVGGNRIVPMKALAAKCTQLGLREVRTFIASGNVLFAASGRDAGAHARVIEKGIRDAFGHEVTVIVCARTELEALVQADPFGKACEERDAKLYVGFLSEEPSIRPRLPQHFPALGVELLGTGERMAFFVSRPVNGKFEVPALPLEKVFGVPQATVRNWNTICRMLAPHPTAK